jgi:hypothetical protein
MKMSESITEVAKALVAAQSEFETATMNATNPFLMSRYADLGAVIEAVRPALSKHGLTFVQPASMADGVVTVETVVLHESGEYIAESISLEATAEKGKSAAQVAGSIITYLRRYGLSAMLGVYADEDNDGAEPTKSASPKRTPQQAPTQAANSWIGDEHSRKSFWAWTGEQGLSHDQVHEALQVESLKEYTGGKGEAARAISAWIEAQQA